LAPLSVVIATMGVFAFSLLSAAPVEIAWTLLIMFSAALYAAYLSLASTHGITFLVVGFALMVITQLILINLSNGPLGSSVLIGLVSVQLLGGAVLRAVLVHRWRDIDWLRFRPLPLRWRSRSPTF